MESFPFREVVYTMMTISAFLWWLALRKPKQEFTDGDNDS